MMQSISSTSFNQIIGFDAKSSLYLLFTANYMPTFSIFSQVLILTMKRTIYSQYLFIKFLHLGDLLGES